MRGPTLFLTAVSLCLFSCGSSPHSPEERYFLIVANVKIPYWQNAAAGLVRSARQLGIRAEIAGPDTFDAKAEQQEFRNVLGQKPAGILVSPSNPDVLKSDIDSAIASGIPVITVDSDSPASKRLLFIGTNNYQAGLLGGQVTAKQLQGKGNVVVFTMPEQGNLIERLKGYQESFSSHPQIKITQIIDIKGDPRIAFDRTTDMIDKKAKVDAFVCLEAIACPEVGEVLSRNQVKDKEVVAMDTDQRTLEWIQKGVIAATLAQRPFTMAFFGLRMLDDLHHHKPKTLDENWSHDTLSPLPSFVDTGALLVDKSNVDEFIRQRQNAANPTS
jgi:ribose transport system substrate-binding protein